MKNAVVGFGTGALFGLGLIVSGMTRPSKVLGFLDIFGAWDASLAFVMIGAIGVHALAYLWIKRRSAPLFAARFDLPEARALDGRLIAGAALFGVGWGLGGFCPGPALTSVAALAPGAVVFVAAMTAGIVLQHLTARPVDRTVESTAADPIR